jgi:hypothetical protein
MSKFSSVQVDAYMMIFAGQLKKQQITGLERFECDRLASTSLTPAGSR